jgi:5'-methylthioadenosine phosphorylase
MEGFESAEELTIDTPFGSPSDVVTIGRLTGMPVAFLPRHGRGHRIMPTEIPVRANIYAMKQLGVEWLISVSAVGSLREEVRPLDMVVPDQLIDRTRLRENTFFGNGIAAHIPFGDPFCPDLSALLANAARTEEVTIHQGGTCVVMEGPAFSTKAESHLYRSWGASVIGMTALPEAKLAREAEICYALLASATDYDVWHESADPVSVEMVLANLLKNMTSSQRVLRSLAPRLDYQRQCVCAHALEKAVITSRDYIQPEVKQRLQAILGKYI